MCSKVIPNLQHMLYAFFGDIDATNFMIMSGPKTANIGEAVQCLFLIPLLLAIPPWAYQALSYRHSPVRNPRRICE